MKGGTQALQFFPSGSLLVLVDTKGEREQEILEDREPVFHDRALVNVDDPGAERLVPELTVRLSIEREGSTDGQMKAAEKPEKTRLPAPRPPPDQGNLPTPQGQVDSLAQRLFGITEGNVP